MSITIGDLKKFMAIAFSDDERSMGEDVGVKAINVIDGNLAFSLTDKDLNFQLVAYPLKSVMKTIAETNN